MVDEPVNLSFELANLQKKFLKIVFLHLVYELLQIRKDQNCYWIYHFKFFLQVVVYKYCFLGLKLIQLKFEFLKH